jgi:hypothetical protein
VQGEPREENGNRRERRLAVDQLRGRSPTPPARASELDNNRHANGGANANADAPPIFRRASQNLAAAAMLLCGCPEPATSEERRAREQLKAPLEAVAAQQAEKLCLAPALGARIGRNAIRPRSGSSSSSSSDAGTWGRSRTRSVCSQEPSRATPRRPTHH